MQPNNRCIAQEAHTDTGDALVYDTHVALLHANGHEVVFRQLRHLHYCERVRRSSAEAHEHFTTGQV